MLVAAKKKENKHDIRPNLVRSRGTNWRGDRGYFQGSAIKGGAYVSSSDWAFHRTHRLGRWGVYYIALRRIIAAHRHYRASDSHGIAGSIWPRNDVKNLARHEMKQFLIEQIPVLFFIADFFLMMALGG